MQNWNQQWQVSAGTTAGTMPQPPTAPGYPQSGTDPMATMQANMQYFNQPAPSGYTTEQWAAAQQQNWNQWQQYQQQYQQWQAQYGAKYQETIKQMSASGMSGYPLVPPVMPPPLPKEDSTIKPPLPPDNANSYSFGNSIPPHQNNLPLFSKPPGNPPLPLGQPPPPPDNPPPSNDNYSGTKRSASNNLTSDSAKKPKNEDDELSHTEKTFDAQFKEWEEQFNKWKLQNANHPDKAQYKQYEAKWTSWREKLIERREQMRKKREAQKAKAESEKKKSLPGNDKLLNILTNTENQGLINNLLGIGKTLGLSGKDNTASNITQTSSPSSSSITGLSTLSTSVNTQDQSAISGIPTTMTSDMTQQAWAAQQWAAQYNMATMTAATPFQTYQSTAVPPPTMTNTQSMMPPNIQGFNQMQPMGGMPNTGINFSQPPPGFPPNPHSMNSQPPVGLSTTSRDGNSQFRRDEDISSNAPFNRGDSYDQSNNNKFNSDRLDKNDRNHSDRDRFRSNDTFDRDGPKRFNRDDRNDFGSDNLRRDGPPSRDFSGSGGGNRGLNNDFHSGDFFGSRERSNDRNYDDDRSGRNEGRFNDRDNFGAPNKESFNSNFDRDQRPNDRFKSDRFPSNDQFNDDRFPNDRFGSDRSLSNDRFPSDRFGSNQNRLDSRDSMDRRDNFGNNNRNMGKNNNRFEQPPKEEMPAELKKLMEKRRTAMDVFKPSSNFLAPEKSKTGFGSLSESFKKITGDSPFLPRERTNEIGRDRGPGSGPAPGSGPGPGLGLGPPPDSFRGSGGFSGSDNRPRDEFRDRGPSDFRSRGLGDFDTRLDTGGLRRSNDFNSRGNNLGSQNKDQDLGKNRGFGNFNNRVEISPWENQPPLSGPPLERPPRVGFGDFRSRPELIPRDNQSPQHPQPLEEPSIKTDNGEKKREPVADSEKNIPPLEVPPWMDPQIMKNPITEGESTNPPSINELQPPSNVEIPEKLPVDQDTNEPVTEPVKKPEGLPFMGENDPKPEDLNMEPPPELPNLGPIKESDNVPFNTRGPGAPPDRSNFFNDPFDGRRMPFKSRGPDSIGSRASENEKFQPPSLLFDPKHSNNSRGGPTNLLPSRISNDGPFDAHNINKPPFSQRGPNEPPFDQRGLEELPFGQRGGLNEPPFGQRGPNEPPFGQRGPNEPPFDQRGLREPPFGQRGLNEPPFDQRGPNQPSFGQRGPNEPLFNQRGPNEPPFDQRGPNEPPFGQRGPNDLPFGQRGPNEPPFDQRGLNEPLFGQRGSNEPPFGHRGPNKPPFDQRGLDEPPFGQRGPNDLPFGQRGPNDLPFGQRGPNNGPFGLRDGPFEREPNVPPFGLNHGPGFGPRGPDNFPQRDAPFGPRDFNDGPMGPNQGPGFGPRGPDNFPQRDVPFGPRDFNDRPPFRPQGPDDSFMPRGQNNMPFNLPPNDNGPKNKIPSLLSFKFDGPLNLQEPRDSMMDLDRPFDRPFRNDNSRPTFGPASMEESRSSFQNDRDMSMRSILPRNECRIDNNNAGSAFGPGLALPQREFDQGFNRPPDPLGPGRPSFGPINPVTRELPDDVSSAVMDPSQDDRDPFSRRPKNHPGYRRSGPVRQEFCIEKQFNYNHGGGAPDEIFTEFVPSKVIDYGNIRRPSVENYITPMQCFDYGHGTIKPNVINHEIFPRIEFKHWLESDHNLKEYNESLKAYENQKKMIKMPERKLRRERDIEINPVWRYEEQKQFDGYRSPWERNEKSWRDPPRNTKEPRDYKPSKESKDSNRGKRRREKSWDRETETHREERVPRSNSEDRTHDKVDKTRKDSNTDYNKKDESKQDVTIVAEEPPKTMELSKPSNITMVDDLLCSPGRQNRPPKIAIILRGPPGSGKSFVAKLIKDKELEQGGSAPRILSLDDYFLTEKEVESVDDNGKKVINKDMVYEYEEAMESSYIASLVKAFKKNIIDGYFNFIILDCINEKIADYEEMWSFAKTKGFRVYVCEMEMDVQICLKRNVHKRTEDEINRIVDYFEPTPNYHQILDVASLLQEQAIQEVQMEEAEITQGETKGTDGNDDSQDSQDEVNPAGVSKWEKMEAEDKLDRLDGLAKRKNEGKPQTMEDFLQVPDYYNMEDTSGKKRVRWADLEERKEQEKMRAVGFVVGQTNWNRMMDPTKGGSALTRTKYI
ncbi:hypothetical protein PV328_009351 [Microctonus aethiopoides]|uniref:YLP motif-containing protein 1 n=1 Tax=Microctonus aethiopoides TaxID=144406 RepID=A0AA39C5K8_9HYME|nr:hypothetical protein PV328_009351 [Microctonus aethiopoides]